MSFKYSQKSRDILSSVNEDLQRLFHEVIETVDIKIIEGLRTPERQEELFRSGKSKTMKSKHLVGDAVDFVPMKDGKPNWNLNDCIYVSGIIRGIASQMELGVRIRLGADWDSDNQTSDETFSDAVHVEIR